MAIQLIPLVSETLILLLFSFCVKQVVLCTSLFKYLFLYTSHMFVYFFILSHSLFIPDKTDYKYKLLFVRCNMWLMLGQGTKILIIQYVHYLQIFVTLNVFQMKNWIVIFFWLISVECLSDSCKLSTFQASH